VGIKLSFINVLLQIITRQHSQTETPDAIPAQTHNNSYTMHTFSSLLINTNYNTPIASTHVTWAPPTDLLHLMFFSPQAGPILPRSPTEGPTYQPLHGRRM